MYTSQLELISLELTIKTFLPQDLFKDHFAWLSKTSPQALNFKYIEKLTPRKDFMEENQTIEQENSKIQKEGGHSFEKEEKSLREKKMGF